MRAENLSQEILTKRNEYLLSIAKVSRQVCCRASSIGVCDREMVYSILEWSKRPTPEPYLQARFEEGKEQERKVIKDLMDLGYDIVEGQTQFEIKDRKGRVIITGMIDGKIREGKERTPFEVKSLDPNIYNSIEAIGDFQKYEWARKYPIQIQLYLYAHNAEDGLLILTDCKGHIKVLTVALDLELVEKVLQRSEYIMDCVEKKILPDFHKNASVCRKCWALGRVCIPPLEFKGDISVIDDPEIEAKLNRWAELKPASKEYEDLDKEIKGYFRGKSNCLCGDFNITGKEQIRKMPAQEAKEIKSWVTKIEKIESK